MIKTIAALLTLVTLTACDPLTVPQVNAESEAKRLELFNNCMKLAADMPRQADDDVSDIVDSCHDSAWYMSGYLRK